MRHVCQERSKHKEPYNFPLVRALFALGNIYIETGHLAAAELCYRTISDYDHAHRQYAGVRLATDLNNLGVVAYIAALNSKHKSDQELELQKANGLFAQSLKELPISNSTGARNLDKPTQNDRADILHNQYLSFRDSVHLEETKQALEAKKPQ